MNQPTIHRSTESRTPRSTSRFRAPHAAVAACWAAVAAGIVNLLIVQSDDVPDRTVPIQIYSAAWAVAAVLLQRRRPGLARGISIWSLAVAAASVVAALFWVRPWGWQQLTERISVPDMYQLAIPSICAVVVLLALRAPNRNRNRS